MKTPRPSIAISAARRALAGLLSMALLAPLAWAGFGVMLERDKARSTAAVIAWIIERHRASEAPPERSIVAALLGVPPFDAGSEQRAVIDASNEPLAQVGSDSAAAWPALTVAQPLALPGGNAAMLQVRRSLRGRLAEVAGIAMASSALALMLWIVFFRQPMGALREAEGRLRRYAHRDALTGLLNREGLRVRLQGALARCQGPRTVGLLVIDLDRFRLVNESLGHPAGDQLLRSVAERISSVTRDGDTLARLGADQFAVQVEGITGTQGLAVMARNLLRALEPAYSLAGRDTVATPSIGVAAAGEPAANADELLQHADAAMLAAKAGGGGQYRVYEPAMQGNTQQRLDIHSRLRRALQRNEFLLAFQPIVDADGERIVGVEALLRWADPERGVVPPGEFIAVLEQTGLIVPVGRWVLLEACKRGVVWSRGAARELKVSVNVSPRQFAEPDFVDTVIAILAETGFSAARLQLEVTEGLLLEPSPQSLRKIDLLADIGIKIAVDDFGMGYSSLAYLKRFRLHALKIDRMFVLDIALHRQDAAIVRAIVELGHALELHVTAEGVETAEQFHELRRLGCDSMQGYLFARPVDADEMAAMLARPGTVGDSAEGAAPGWHTTMAALLDMVELNRRPRV